MRCRKRTGATQENIEAAEVTPPLGLGDDDCLSVAFSPLGDLVATAEQETLRNSVVPQMFNRRGSRFPIVSSGAIRHAGGR
ncbi:hypothetical protein AB0K35_26170 [Micromonospora sp. NPDC053740]|uniref:hypothetical protein n=1 Tax=Micromonospora sp. NPDC053740 TaxID=3155173 RepID=UPI0034352A25